MFEMLKFVIFLGEESFGGCKLKGVKECDGLNNFINFVWFLTLWVYLTMIWCIKWGYEGKVYDLCNLRCFEVVERKTQ